MKKWIIPALIAIVLIGIVLWLGLLPLLPVIAGLILIGIVIYNHLPFIIEWTLIILIVGVVMYWAMLWAYQLGMLA